MELHRNTKFSLAYYNYVGTEESDGKKTKKYDVCNVEVFDSLFAALAGLEIRKNGDGFFTSEEIVEHNATLAIQKTIDPDMNTPRKYDEARSMYRKFEAGLV